jgi:spore maturation protein CgeB
VSRKPGTPASRGPGIPASRGLDILVLGLTLSSSWGNGHATTWRALLRGLAGLGHRVRFLERDMPWYASHRDLASPDFCDLHYYDSVGELRARWGGAIARADAVIVGSYVPEGAAVIDLVQSLAPLAAFYDIDTPVTLAKLGSGDEEYLARRQIPRFDLYFSFTGGPTLERLERDFGARAARALYCAVDETRYRPTGAALRWDLGYLGTFSPDRQDALERLLLEPARRLPDMRFVVAGPQYPDTIAWPANVARIEHLPPAAHADFYSRQRFTLNVTRADMLAAGWSPSVRLFEAAACGAPIVSDPWEGLSDLLSEGEAVVIARGTEDVIAALTAMPDPVRARLGQAARARVLEAHTGRARARELLAELSLRGAQTPGRAVG